MAGPRMKLYSQCSRGESRAYREAHFLVLDLVGAARVKFKTLAACAQSLTAASNYKAWALEVARDAELVKNEYRAFLRDESPIIFPEEKTLRTIERALKQLVQSEPVVANGAEIVKQLNRGMNAFGTIHGA
jgi:hypothetical protein